MRSNKTERRRKIGCYAFDLFYIFHFYANFDLWTKLYNTRDSTNKCVINKMSTKFICENISLGKWLHYITAFIKIKCCENHCKKICIYENIFISCIYCYIQFYMYTDEKKRKKVFSQFPFHAFFLLLLMKSFFLGYFHFILSLQGEKGTVEPFGKDQT